MNLAAGPRPRYSSRAKQVTDGSPSLFSLSQSATPHRRHPAPASQSRSQATSSGACSYAWSSDSAGAWGSSHQQQHDGPGHHHRRGAHRAAGVSSGAHQVLERRVLGVAPEAAPVLMPPRRTSASWTASATEPGPYRPDRHGRLGQRAAGQRQIQSTALCLDRLRLLEARTLRIEGRAWEQRDGIRITRPDQISAQV